METKKEKSTKTAKKDKAERGRPSVMTQDTLTKLQLAFETGASDREACLFAGISPATLYNYQEEHTDYVEQKEAWKEKPIFIARQAVIKQFQNGDGDLVLKYLEHKKKDEFAPKATVDFGVSQELQESIGKIKDIFDTVKGAKKK